MASRRAFPARLLAISACAATLLASPLRAETGLPEVSRLLNQGQHIQALEQVDKYLSTKPKDAQGRFLKGVILTEMNKPAEAVSVFTKLTEDYPELPEPYNNLAVIYAQQKQYDKAKQALEMAIKTHPSYATAHENLGDIYARMASQAYDKALQLDSANSSAQIKLSTIRELISANNARQGTAKPAAKPVVVAAAEPPKAPEPKAPEPKPVEVKPPEAKPAEPPKPVAEPKPAAKVEEAPKAAAGNSADVATALDGWAAAWSRKDVKAYLAHYAKDFQTPGGEPRAAWEAERAKRINKPGTIHVSLDSLHVSFADDKATARFRQYYKSATLKTGTSKLMVLVRRDGRWLIQQEKVGS